MTQMENARTEAGADLTAGRRVGQHTTRHKRARQQAVAVIRARDRTRRVVVAGRQLWALRQLLEAGPRGCTPFHNPAPRWSSYVARLRGKGVPIDTIHEEHAGPYPGRHGRYVLAGDVELEQLAEAGGGDDDRRRDGGHLK